jgi:hypothetical protein
MYVVELGSIWIWKYIEMFFDNWFLKNLNCLKKHNLSQLKHGTMGNILDFFIIKVDVYWIMCIFYINILFYFIEHHILQEVVVWELVI